MQSQNLIGSNGHTIPLYQWPTKLTPKAILHISHGMAEHGQRYQRLAEFFNNHGYIVYAHDHRGHGNTIPTTGQGFFTEKDGWTKVVDDLNHVINHIENNHPELPVIALGHSMGSYILQSYLVRYNPRFAGCVLSGSNLAPKFLLYVARAIARFECLRQGDNGKSPIIKQLTFAQYSRAFKPRRTEFDWLSRDPVEVDNYVKNPICGFFCTNKMWHDLFGGLLEISTINNLQQINSEIPVLILGGEDDPVSAPDGQHKLASALNKAGLKNITLNLYPEGRHEMFNEINREQVTERLLQWIDKLIC